MSVDEIDAVLPQTQCRQCGFDGCRPYAAALADGRADIDRCPPGGDAGVARLAGLLGRSPIALNPAYGTPKPLALARIDETLCIGCTLCIQACPVDAIVGGAKRMHDVVADLCTGCELCLPPCPVDCIDLVPAAYAWSDAHAATARTRHHARAARLSRHATIGTRVSDVTAAPTPPTPTPTSASRKQAILDAAIERARLQRLGRAAARAPNGP